MRLGAGFLEKVYENALAIELRDEGMAALQQARVDVRYKGKVVGEYVADIIVNDKVVEVLTLYQRLFAFICGQ